MSKLLVIAFLFISLNSFAQDKRDSSDTDYNNLMELIETNIENNGASADFNTILEQLEYYREHPINLNKADRGQLQELGFFGDTQIDKILEHRSIYGSYVDKRELRSLGVLSDRELELLYPFISVSGSGQEEKQAFLKSLTQGNHLVMLRLQRILEQQQGYLPPDTNTDGSLKNHYPGNPWKYYARYRYSLGYKFSTGVTLEKDAGEDFFTGSNSAQGLKLWKGFDYHSAHLFLRPGGKVGAVALGDYQLMFGQGLVMWNGLAFGKSAYVMNAKRSGLELKQYTSVNEFNFQRGAAAQFNHKNASLITFVSKKNLDANISVADSINDEVLEVSSIQEDGFHRTASEVEDEGSLGQTLMGARATYAGKHFKIGGTAIHNTTEAPLVKNVQPYNQFEFQGDQLQNYGFDYRYSGRGWELYGENAYSSNGGVATLNGLIVHPAAFAKLLLMHRHITRDYFSFYANAFTERSTPNNENGVYMATEISPVKGIEIWSYYDSYKHPWLRFGVDAPSRGVDYLLQVNYTPSKYLNMYWRFKEERKQVNLAGNDTPGDFLVDTRQTKFRYHIKYDVTYALSIRSRFEYVYTHDGSKGEDGFLMYQDISYRIRRSPFKFSARFAYFDTQSFNSAIYAYESDVLYAFSVPAYFYKGSRVYIVGRWKIKRNLNFYARYARFHYANRSTVGSSLDEIQTPHKSEVKFQLMYRF